MTTEKNPYAPPYSDDMYENDPELMPRTPRMKAMVNDMTFRYLNSIGIGPDDAKEMKDQTPEFIAAFREWIADDLKDE